MTDIPEKRERWHSRFAFIMAAVGSAVGLGNVWRFPYMCYEYGGGAFFIPFFIALFTCGIPLMILEFTLGHWARGSPPKAFAKIGKQWEWLGWWPIIVEFLTVIYYSVIIAWCFNYMIYSLDLRWGSNAESFFVGNFLGLTSKPEILGDIKVPVVLGLIVIWLMIYLILRKGVKSIGKVVLITVPLPTILLIILTIRGLTLPGAMTGISYYLTPDFSKLWNAKIWLAAYSQVLWSLGIAGGIMITYASFLPKKSDITNNAIIISLIDAGTSFLAGFAVFSVLGYLAFSMEVGLEKVVKVGPELAFVVYPTAISLLPFAAAFFGIIFFIALLTFGIDSAFSMVEPFPVGLNDKWNISKEKSTGIICLIGFLVSLIYATGSGLHWLSISDYFLANFGIALVALFECLVVGYMFHLHRLRKHANDVSEIKIGKWWEMLIKVVNPIVLIGLFIMVIIENIMGRYEGYSTFALLVGGVSLAVTAFVLSFVLMRIKGRKTL
ncbi:MAG: sodium-dependent transporter [Thermoplasmatales archaeon]|nr:MAG: sodium-dependent transporter [Thermoplasmatales archaeon]